MAAVCAVRWSGRLPHCRQRPRLARRKLLLGRSTTMRLLWLFRQWEPAERAKVPGHGEGGAEEASC